MTPSAPRRSALVVSGLLVLLGGILYFPLLRTGFASDDFEIIYRLTHSGKAAAGFFRPLSDASLLLNYQLAGGYHPLSFHLFNVGLHIANSVLLFFIGRSLFNASEGVVPWQSFMFAALFLCYPFHSEVVSWITARGASMAACCGLLSIWFAIGKNKMIYALPLTCIFYFIGLLCFETIFPLPLIILLLLPASERQPKNIARWVAGFGITLLVHFLLRIHYAGSITGAYAGDIFHLSLRAYAGHFFRIATRSLLPPMQETVQFVTVAACTALLLLFLLFLYWRKTSNYSFIMRMLIAWVASVLVAVTFPVSTHTSESDRLLYFPAIWTCAILVHWIQVAVASKPIRWSLFLFLFLASAILIRDNNARWLKASKTINELIELLRTESAGDKQIYLFNLPGEYKGAYILRNGFTEALLMKGVDTTGITALNVLNHKDLPGQRIRPVYTPGTISWSPTEYLYIRNGRLDIFAAGSPPVQALAEATHIWYWDTEQFRRLTLP